MALKCEIKSVTLQANEPFNLPPNSRLISATNVNALTSTCPIPELEPLECWIIYIGMPDADDGDSNAIWMNGADLGGSNGIGITVSGVFYPFYMPQGFEGEPQLGGFVNYVQTNPTLSGFLIDPNTLNAVNGDVGGAATFCFKAPASVASTVFITWKTGVNKPLDNLQGEIFAHFKAVPYATFTGKPKCTCTLPPTT